jgi:histidinol-phosphate aminotransferase
VCTNPFGPSPEVYKALAEVKIDLYPDRESHQLRMALAERFGISTRCILMGNGVSELIWLTALAFVQPNERIFVIGPTYGEYARSVTLQSGKLHTWNAREENRFAISTPEIEVQFERCRPAVVFLCNPNNPTGTALAPEQIQVWLMRYPKTLFIVDEAYQNFAVGLKSLVSAQADNLLVLRSMTKDYALAGLRLGYAVGPETKIAVLSAIQPPWSVNSLAQVAARAALRDEEYLAQSLEQLRQAKQELMTGLLDLGLLVCLSATHFFLVKVGNATAFRLKLLSRGILVRDATSFGLPDWIRLATRRPEDNARLLAVLREEQR